MAVKIELTLENVMAIVRKRGVIEEGDCLLWQRGCAKGGYPRTCIGGRQYMLQRLLLGLRRGRSLGRAEVARTRCGNRDCVNPEHLYRGTSAALLAEVNKGNSMRADVRARLTARNRARSAKLTAAQVIEIRRRIGTATQTEIGRDYGVKQNTISLIARGETWRDVGGGNVWSGLMR